MAIEQTADVRDMRVTLQAQKSMRVDRRAGAIEPARMRPRL